MLKVNLAASPVSVSVFTESINGADGIAFDDSGILWVAANQADEIVGLNAAGRVVAKIGAFEKIGADGAPEGLLFPASLVLVGREVYITNLALPLTPAVGDEPEEMSRAGPCRASGCCRIVGTEYRPKSDASV